jgi:hypothetical protein
MLSVLDLMSLPFDSSYHGRTETISTSDSP